MTRLGRLIALALALLLALSAPWSFVTAASSGDSGAAAASFASEQLSALRAGDCAEGASVLAQLSKKGQRGDPLASAHALHRVLAVRWQKLQYQLAEKEQKENAAAAAAELRVCALFTLRHTAQLVSTNKAFQGAHAASWSWLASALQSARAPGADVSLCFGETRRLLSGKGGGIITPAVTAWDVLGPFVHAKTELDGDGLEGLLPPLGPPGAQRSGIERAELDRASGNTSYPSELAEGGSVRWRELLPAPASSGGSTTLTFPSVRWNDLAQSVSMSSLEAASWLVGVIHVTRAGRFAAHCRGVAYFTVDGTSYAGDQYSNGRVMAAMNLARGPHVVRLRVRAKVQTQFACSFAPVGEKNSLRLFEPAFLPDVLLPATEAAAQPQMFGSWIAVPVLSLSAHWLTRLSFAVESAGGGAAAFEVAPLAEQAPLEHALQSAALPSVAPGTITYVPLRLRLREGAAHAGKCPSPFKLSLTAFYRSDEGSDASAESERALHSNSLTLSLRCRRSLGESFLLSFLDADGSTVSQAGVVPPASPCVVPAGSLAQSCPVVLASHGMGANALSMADAFKYKPRQSDKDYTFGIAGAWVLAPSRFGAHNHEGPIGGGTIDAALAALAELTVTSALYSDRRADPWRVVSTGHSMGGHGSWLWAVRHPDRLLCAAPAAGWIDKQQYSDANRAWEEDQALAHTDSHLRGLLRAAVDEDAVDVLAPHLAGVPTLVRVGADDRTTHPYYSRRMVRLLREWNARAFARSPADSPEEQTRRDSLATLSEIEKMQHWWWDTRTPNDGGAMHDAQMRAFWRRCLESPTGAALPPLPPEFELRALQPSTVESKGGLYIAALQRPAQLASIRVRRDPSARVWHLRTSNVVRFGLLRVPGLLTEDLVPEGGFIVDEQANTGISQAQLQKLLVAQNSAQGTHLHRMEICRHALTGVWAICTPEGGDLSGRGVSQSGPMRQVYARPFLFVVGTAGSADASSGGKSSSAAIALEHQQLASFFGNLHAMAAETHVRVVRDVDLLAALRVDGAASEALQRLEPNLILLGGRESNAYVRAVAEWCEGHSAASAAFCARFTLGATHSSSGGSDARFSYRVSGAPDRCSYTSSRENKLAALFLAPLPPMAQLRAVAGKEAVPSCGGNNAVDGAYAAAESTCSAANSQSSGSAASKSPVISSRAIALVLDGPSRVARRALSRLLEPAIPPMVRAPLTNLAPDYLLVDAQRVLWQGWGGVRAAGYLDDEWRHQPARAYDTC